LVRWTVGALAAVALLGVLRAKPWARPSSALPPEKAGDERQALAVGFLPVT
jgi:hypothetical protein